jgi:hypothetical protein
LKIKIYKTIILPIVLYGCEPLREERRLRELRRIFEPKRDVSGEGSTMRSFILCTVRVIKSRRLK